MEVTLLRFSKAFLLSEVISGDDDDGKTNADNVQMSFGSPLGVVRAPPSASPSS